MSDLGRLLDPATVAIVGLSADLAKHGGRVLANLRKLGFAGTIWGVNPGLPEVEEVEMLGSISDLPTPPDLVVCAIPAAAVAEVVAGSTGAGGVVVFAGGFGESSADGRALEQDLADRARSVGVRVLGPNSGGVIRPSRSLAASFLTCLDRPAEEIRTGPVGVVTQSGGTGSYLHNLAAARGGGLAISVSTGNEVDIKLGEAIDAVSRLDEVNVVLALIETVRDGPVLIEAIRASLAGGKPVVACRIGTGRHGKTLMTTHTGAMAVPDAVLGGVLESLGVVVAETPGEAYEVAEMMARATMPAGDRAAIVTHSGGVAILLSDLAERHGVNLPTPSVELRARLDPLLDHGAADNPLDMGGIIGGPRRFAEVVDVFAGSLEYDLVMAVSTAHPPAHTDERVRSLVPLHSGGTDASERVEGGVSVLHLWMAGDQASHGLDRLREAGAPVSEEPRAAVRALAGLVHLTRIAPQTTLGPIRGNLEDWGLPLVDGELARDADDAVAIAEGFGYPVVVKVISPGLAHKTEVGGVRLGLNNAEAVRTAFEEVVAATKALGLEADGARVERYRPGLEIVVGGMNDETFGLLVSVGLGGVFTELLGDVVFAPAPVDSNQAAMMIERLQGRALFDGFRGGPVADLVELARIISLVSRGLVGSGLQEVELNPLVWDGLEWVAVDWLTVP